MCKYTEIKGNLSVRFSKSAAFQISAWFTTSVALYKSKTQPLLPPSFWSCLVSVSPMFALGVN